MVRYRPWKQLIKQITEKFKLRQGEFNGKPISALHYKNGEEEPKVYRQPTIIFPATLQEFQNGRGYVIANCIPVPWLVLEIQGNNHLI